MYVTKDLCHRVWSEENVQIIGSNKWSDIRSKKQRRKQNLCCLGLNPRLNTQLLCLFPKLWCLSSQFPSPGDLFQSLWMSKSPLSFQVSKQTAVSSLSYSVVMFPWLLRHRRKKQMKRRREMKVEGVNRITGCSVGRRMASRLGRGEENTKGLRCYKPLAARLGLNWRGMTQTVYSMGENGRNPCSSMVSIMQTLTQLRKTQSQKWEECVRGRQESQTGHSRTDVSVCCYC